MPKIRLTDLAIKNLKIPQSGQVIHWDDSLPGFGVRVSQGGTKTFTLVHGDRSHREKTTIGRYPIISLQDARIEAKRILAERTLRKHRPTRIRFSEALELFVTTHLTPKNKPSSALSTERRLRSHFLPVLEKSYLEDIAPAHISTVIDRLIGAAKPSEANHAHVALGTFLNWAVARHYLTHSPLKGGLPARIQSRDRTLSDQEMVHVWRTCEAIAQFGRLTQLLLATGQRRNQIASLDANWINYEERTITFPAAVMKRNKEHRIYYHDTTALLLETLPKSGLLFPARGTTDTAFSGFSKGKAKLDKLCPLQPWSLHDARRFYSSTMARLGVPLHLTERLLSHAGVISGVAAIYNRYEFRDELRAAVAQYENHLSRLLCDPCL